MGRGLILGMLSGTVIMAAVLAGVSLLAPLPQAPDRPVVTARPAAVGVPMGDDPAPAAPVTQQVPEAGDSAAQAEVPLPAGSQFNQPPTDVAPALPETDTSPSSDTPSDPSAPDTGSVIAPPQPDTAPSDAPVAVAVLDAPSAPQGETSAPVASDTIDPAAPPASFQPAPLASPLPQIGTAQDDAPGVITDDTVPGFPTLQSEAEAEAAASAPLPALIANGIPYTPKGDRPMMSIVLIDSEQTRLDRENLLGFSFPVTFAIDAARPDAADIAALYRASGFEVAMLADSLPRNATAQDIEVAFQGALQVLPQAVAMIDSSNGFLQRTRSALDPMVAAMLETGHGFVTYESGLNSGEATARREGVPTLAFYRSLDADNERSVIITRYLDRATFEAGQDGHVVVVGHTYADTVTALYSWRLSSRADSVEVVPLSTILLERGLLE